LKHKDQSDKAVLLPELLGHDLLDDGINLTLCIPENLTYFVGHFDQIPIVPGVVQIQWAVHYAHEYLGLDKRFSHMEAVKFKELLLSGEPLQLSLRYQSEAGKLVFCYRSESTEYSSGRIYFHHDNV